MKKIYTDEVAIKNYIHTTNANYNVVKEHFTTAMNELNLDAKEALQWIKNINRETYADYVQKAYEKLLKSNGLSSVMNEGGISFTPWVRANTANCKWLYTLVSQLSFGYYRGCCKYVGIEFITLNKDNEPTLQKGFEKEIAERFTDYAQNKEQETKIEKYNNIIKALKELNLTPHGLSKHIYSNSVHDEYKLTEIGISAIKNTK